MREKTKKVCEKREKGYNTVSLVVVIVILLLLLVAINNAFSLVYTMVKSGYISSSDSKTENYSNNCTEKEEIKAISYCNSNPGGIYESSVCNNPIRIVCSN